MPVRLSSDALANPEIPHFEEGAEDIGVVVQDGLLQLDGELGALGSVKLGGELVEQVVDVLVLVGTEVVAHAGHAAGGEEVLRVAGGCGHESGGGLKSRPSSPAP